ncbi:MAG: helix-turn-helix domain-containing protein [Lachnospiraceae bacterium]
MEQRKTGAFLKNLRKEKGLTQGQLAEHFNVSDRTISRWETGSNMPDLCLLVELADFYHVDIREIIDGERKSGKMNPEEKEMLLKVVDYSENERNVLMKRVCTISIAGLAALLLALLFNSVLLGTINPLLMCMENVCYGLAVGALLTCIFFTTGVLSKIRNNNKSRKAACILRVICPIIVAICIVVCTIITIL